MRTYLRTLLLLTVVAITFPLLAADEQKKDADKPAVDKAEAKKDAAKKDDEPAKDDPPAKTDKKTVKKAEKDKADKKPKFTHGAVFIGKVTQLDANSQRQFTVQVTTKQASPNQGAANTYAQQQQQHQQRYFQIMNGRITNPQQLLQRQQQLYQLQVQQAQSLATYQQNMYTYKDVTKDFLLKGTEDMKVRVPAPPPDYDDKGNLKKYTAKDLQELKGPDNLPGYTAEIESLRTGQYVQVYLKAPATPAKKGTGGKTGAVPGGKGGVPGLGGPGGIPGLGAPEKGGGGALGGLGGLKLNDDDDALAGPPRFPVVMIVILGEQQK